MTGNRTFLPNLAVILCVMTLAMLSMRAFAGPAILSTAQPDYRDPLAGAIRPVADRFAVPGDPGIDNIDNPASETAGTDSSDFTIIGDQGTSGLEEPEIDDLTRAVRDEILGRTDSVLDNGAGDSVGADSSGSASGIVRALVNSVPGQAGAAGPSGAAQRGGDGGNRGLVASVIDATVTDLVVTLLNPEQAADGMVTFSIAAFGNFALLHLQENNSFFVVDLDGGTALKIARGEQSLTAGSTLQRSASKEQTRQVRGKSNALQRVISFLEDNVLPFVQSPITLAALGLFSIIWIIWRLSARG